MTKEEFEAQGNLIVMGLFVHRGRVQGAFTKIFLREPPGLEKNIAGNIDGTKTDTTIREEETADHEESKEDEMQQMWQWQ